MAIVVTFAQKNKSFFETGIAKLELPTNLSSTLLKRLAYCR